MRSPAPLLPPLLARATRGRRLRNRPTAIAAAATLAIVGSLMTSATPAHAAEASIAAAVQDGSFLQDVIEGHIGVPQLVDVDMAGLANRAPAPDRETLTRQITAEVDQLRATGRIDAWGADPEPDAQRPLDAASADPLVATQLSFWHKLKHLFAHWATVRITAPTGGALLGGGTAAGIAALVAGYFGLIASAAILALGATAFLTLGAVSMSCSARHLKYLYIKVPDLGHSHCGN